jgi:hypothetical protein
MPQDALLAVLGRAAIDPAFLNQLKADPEAASKSAGVALSSDQIAQLKKLNFEGLTEFGKQVEAKRLAAIIDKKDA